MPKPRPRHPDLTSRLRIKLRGAKRIAVLAVGSELRGDDDAGLLAGREIERLWGATRRLRPKNHSYKVGWHGLLASRVVSRGNTACKQAVPPPEILRVFMGGTAPENFSGAIRKFRPTHLVLIDAADMGKKPGSVSLLDSERLIDTASFSTHSLPLNLLTEYLRSELGCEVLVIGIQPLTREFGRPISEEVATAARAVAASVVRSLIRK